MIVDVLVVLDPCVGDGASCLRVMVVEGRMVWRKYCGGCANNWTNLSHDDGYERVLTEEESCEREREVYGRRSALDLP